MILKILQGKTEVTQLICKSFILKKDYNNDLKQILSDFYVAFFPLSTAEALFSMLNVFGAKAQTLFLS
jgi:hypothetical protein